MQYILKPYLQLIRFDKPIGFFLLLWPTLWGLWLASKGHPPPVLIGIFVLGTFLMRSAGCVMNDLADRQFDGGVERTRERPLVTGKISVSGALGILFILLLFSLGLVLFLNRLTILMAMIGVLLAALYPFLKRITHLPQAGLGLAFSWGIPCSFTAVTHTLSLQMLVVFLPALLWPLIYDTIYAMVDKKDDLLVGIKSTAILFAEWDKCIISVLQIIFLILLLHMGWYFKLNAFYYCSVFCTGLLFLYQYILIKDRLPAKCFAAFLNNHWVGFFIFLGILFN